MNDVLRRREDRFRFLEAVYRHTDGNYLQDVQEDDIGVELALSRDQVRVITIYLLNEGLIDATAGGMVSVTHEGMKQVEEALAHPEEETKYFPPVSNVINFYGAASNPQIQQGTIQSLQVNRVEPAERDVLERILTDIKSHLDDLNLSGDLRRELSADIATVEQQLASPNPKAPVIGAVLVSIRAIVESAGGEMVADWVQALDQMPFLG